VLVPLCANICYTIQLGEDNLQLEGNCVDCRRPCGPRSNLDFVRFKWSNLFVILEAMP